MTSHYLARAWKDPDVREAVGLPAHPSGEIELDDDPLVGGTSLPCATVVSAASAWATHEFSCINQCDVSYNAGGTCALLSVGCC